MSWPTSAITCPSPPSRGRGSKPFCAERIGGNKASPPSRGRGSKHYAPNARLVLWRRLPRGGVDRNSVNEAIKRVCYVASLAGAWIETGYATPYVSGAIVASLAGAWIETMPLAL